MRKVRKDIKQSMNQDEFQQVLNKRFGKRFTATSGFKSRKDTVKVFCHNCKLYQNIEVSKLLNNGGCYNCHKETISRGENMIVSLLIENKIKFKPQYAIYPKGYPYWLKVDFYLPDYNTFIEFDGSCHYDKDNFYYNDAYHKRDLLKNKYARDNHINLIRIRSYKYFTVKEIIEKSLGITLKIPEILKYRNYDLPVYEIYKYLRSHTIKETVSKYWMYSLTKQRLHGLYDMYNDTPLEIKKFGNKLDFKIIDQKSFESQLNSMYGNKYTILSPYKGTQDYLKVHCNKCNHTFKAYAHSLLHPRNLKSGGCPYCAGNFKKDNEYIQKELAKIYPYNKLANGQYELIDTYVRSNDKMKILCHKCNKVIYKSWHDLDHGNGCRCSSIRFGDGSDKDNYQKYSSGQKAS